MARGAGETTLLLEYVADRLQDAERDAATPIPVVFHLSAWPAEQPPLAEWVADELALRYGVARLLAVELVAGDRLVVLLDGLDKVPEARQEACVAAINAFRDEHGGVPLVVCARTRSSLPGWSSRGAVAVQPLDRGQVRGWLAAAGRPLAGLRAALRDPAHWLWGLLDSPLLLSIAALTYMGEPATAVRAHGSVEGLLGAYVKARLARPRVPLAAPQDQVAYADTDTLRWLAWLAEQMGTEGVFYPDWMQPDWLPTRWQRRLVTIGPGLAAGLFGGLAVGLAAGLAGGLVEALVMSLAVGMAIGFGTDRTRNRSRIEPIEPTRWSWSTARSGGLGVGLGVGLICAVRSFRGERQKPGLQRAGLLVGRLTAYSLLRKWLLVGPIP